MIIQGPQGGPSMDAIERMVVGRLSELTAKVMADPEARANLEQLAELFAQKVAAALVQQTTLEAVEAPAEEPTT